MDKANANADNSSNYNDCDTFASKWWTNDLTKEDTEEDIFAQSGNLFHDYGDYKITEGTKEWYM